MRMDILSKMFWNYGRKVQHYEAAKEVVEKLCGILGEEHSEVKNAKEELDLNYWAEEN